MDASSEQTGAAESNGDQVAPGRSSVFRRLSLFASQRSLDFEKRKARRRAREDVVRILRSYGSVIYGELGFSEKRSPQTITDAELFTAFSLVESPGNFARNILRCSPHECSSLEINMATAVQHVSEQPLDHHEWTWLQWMYCGATCVWLAALIGLSTAYIALLFENSQWREGNCRLLAHTSGSCQRDCLVDVKIIADGGLVHTMKRWTLPWNKNRNTGKLQMEEKPFQCCDLSCCTWHDASIGRWCDNWPHMNQENGNQCPSAPWRCRFQSQHGEVTKLEALGDDALFELACAIACTLSLAFFAAVFRWREKIHRVCPCFPSCPSSCLSFGEEHTNEAPKELNEHSFFSMRPSPISGNPLRAAGRTAKRPIPPVPPSPPRAQDGELRVTPVATHADLVVPFEHEEDDKPTKKPYDVRASTRAKKKTSPTSPRISLSPMGINHTSKVGLSSSTIATDHKSKLSPSPASPHMVTRPTKQPDALIRPIITPLRGPSRARLGQGQASLKQPPMPPQASTFHQELGKENLTDRAPSKAGPAHFQVLHNRSAQESRLSALKVEDL